MSNITLPPWQPTPSQWTVAYGEAVIFRVDLSGNSTADDETLLSADDRIRARQLRFDQHRHRWILCRAALRRLLAHATGTLPAAVPITCTPHGKPYLPNADIDFNVSHSQDLALIALTRGAEVGIDVELLNPSPDLPAIATRFFTPAEESHLTTGPPDSLPLRFYQIWTRKEALLKSLGQGLLHPPECIDISPTLLSPVSTIALPDLTPSRPRLIVELHPTPTSIAALVTDRSVNSFTLFWLS